MAKMKKAILFSIVSLFLVILLVSSTELLTQFRQSESEIEVTRTRVKLLNSLIKDMETQYFDRIIYVASKNALEGISQYYHDNNFGVGDYDYRLYRALNMTVWDGLYNEGGNVIDFKTEGCGSFGNDPCMDEEYTLNNLLIKIRDEFNYLGINPDINIQIKSVSQRDPWHIQVGADIDYFFKDNSNIATWKGFTHRDVNVSVYGLYANYFKGKITSDWRYDNGTKTEPYAVSMLEGRNSVISGIGICPPSIGCDES